MLEKAAGRRHGRSRVLTFPTAGPRAAQRGPSTAFAPGVAGRLRRGVGILQGPAGARRFATGKVKKTAASTSSKGTRSRITTNEEVLGTADSHLDDLRAPRGRRERGRTAFCSTTACLGGSRSSPTRQAEGALVAARSCTAVCSRTTRASTCRAWRCAPRAIVDRRTKRICLFGIKNGVDYVGPVVRAQGPQGPRPVVAR